MQDRPEVDVDGEEDAEEDAEVSEGEVSVDLDHANVADQNMVREDSPDPDPDAAPLGDPEANVSEDDEGFEAREAAQAADLALAQALQRGARILPARGSHTTNQMGVL